MAGQAFASGTVVRYVPEQAELTGPRTALLEYAAYPEGLRARSVDRTHPGDGQAPARPGQERPNQPPTARSFSASVTAGDTISITVPTSGVDPDGDLAFVGGIVGEDGQAVDLELGRVLGFGAATIRYEAYPRSSGTEVIRYQLRDRFGAGERGLHPRRRRAAGRPAAAGGRRGRHRRRPGPHGPRRRARQRPHRGAVTR